MPSMATQTQGRDAVTFKSFTDEVLDEKDRLLINEMITAYRKGDFDPLYYISRVAVLSQHRMLRDAFERHENLIIESARRAHDRTS